MKGQLSRTTPAVLQPNDALAPGDAATGLIKFRLAFDADPVAIIYSPDPDRAIILAEAGLGFAESTTPSIFTPEGAVASPDCEGIVTWGDDALARVQDAAGEGLLDILILAPTEQSDPSRYRQLAENYRAAAAAQEASNPPPAAVDANATLVTYFLDEAAVDRGSPS